MIVVSMDLWPASNPMKRKCLAIGTIGNDGTGDVKKGNYTITFRDHTNTLHEARVEGFPREQGGLRLLHEALMNVFEETDANTT